MKPNALVVSSDFAGNHELTFATTLPKIAAPWPGMGNVKSLRMIGELLDSLPVMGADEPYWSWSVAAKVAQIHHDYTQPGGEYHTSYPTPTPRHTQYLPGTILASPVYEGRYNKWGFEVVLRDGASRSELRLYVGPYNDSGARLLSGDVDAGTYKNHDDDRITSAVEKALWDAGIKCNC